jgi:hypothetical protein
MASWSWFWSFLLLVVVRGVDGYGYGYGLEAAISRATEDPLAEVDTFAALAPPLLRLLSHPVGFDVDKKKEEILSLESTTLLRVRLVGFSEDRRRLAQLESQLSKYVDALNHDIYTNVIGHEPHRMVAKTRLSLEVERIQGDLGEKIHGAIGQAISQSTSLRTYHQHHQVSHEVVDNMVRAQLEDPLPAYTIYLLNLKPQKQGKYGYVYGESRGSIHRTTCLGTLWAGKKRYMWVDLAAGPVEYGPASSGEGYVKGEMLPLASSYGLGQENAFAADLASLVWSAAQMLLAPSVRIPVHFEEHLEVHFVHIIGGNETMNDPYGLDFKAVEAQFVEAQNQGLLFSRQSLKFKHATVKLSECTECSAAFSRALRTYTSRIHLESYGLFLDEYLDSKELHSFLSQFGEELAQEGGLRRPESHATRVLPVYVWDLDTDRQLLLDRFHQVMPFRDMVIAVRTVVAQAVIEYSCNGQQLLVSTRHLERPIVGGLLQSLFGVTPTHVTWSSKHNSTMVDYRWGIGHTPFGPFAESSSLSFAQRDAARRNTIVTMLNVTMSGVLETLQSIKEYGGEKELLGMKHHLEYTQRWNLLVYKLSKVMTAMSHFDFDSALYFVKSSEHEMHALHGLAFLASTEFEASLKCFDDPPFPWITIGLWMGVAGAILYAWSMRDKFFVNKKKRF